MKERWIIQTGNDNHQRTHYWNDDTEHNSAQAKLLQLVEHVRNKQDKNGHEDHYRQIRPVPVITIKHVGQKQATKNGCSKCDGVGEYDRSAKLKG